MRYIVLTIFIVVAFLLPTTASAHHTPWNDEVAINATGYEPILDPPYNFSLAKIGNVQVDLSWSAGIGATNTVIRRNLGSFPVNPMDGVGIYDGTALNISDTLEIDLREYDYYYRAWSFTNPDYSIEFAEASTRSGAMLLIAMIVLCMGLTVFGVTKRITPLMIISGLAWVGLWFSGYFGHAPDQEYWAFAVVSMSLALFCFFYLPVSNYITKRESIKKAQEDRKIIVKEDREKEEYAERLEETWIPKGRESKKPARRK